MPIPRDLFGDDDFSLDDLLDNSELDFSNRQKEKQHRNITPAKDVDEVFQPVDLSSEYEEPSFTDIDPWSNGGSDPWADVEESKPAAAPTKASSVTDDTIAQRGRKRPVQASPQTKKKSRSKNKKRSGDFVDEENLRLKPFGKREAKRAEKAGEFDKRKNLKDKARMVQFGVLGGLAFLVLFGGYKTFVGSEGLTVDEVAEIAYAVNGETGFPAEAGETFARQYLEAFLVYDGTAQASARLSPYGLQAPSNEGFKMNIVYGPELENSKFFSADAAQYTFSVGYIIPEPPVEGEAAAPVDEIRWVSFAVNVYYNADNGTFGIQRQPTVVPSSKLVPSGEIPAGINLSSSGKESSDSNLSAEVSNTVTQFLTEYFKASPGNTAALEQYLIPDPAPELLTGLNNQFVMVSNPVIEAWSSGDSVQVQATATMNAVGGVGSFTTQSVYAVMLVDVGGRYLVSDVVALGYMPIPESE